MKKVCVVLMLFTVVFLALTTNVSAGSTATDLLLAKARSLEGRGRLDLAAQSWRQVLMADPNQPEALAGLARWAKQNGHNDEAQQYLDRLRAINPNDPALGRIAELKVIGPKQRAQLEEAGRLAGAHQYEESMRIYREVLGDDPPPGSWAIAYYETEAATPDGYGTAVAGLRKLSQRFPADMAYRLSLGRLLTYRPKTRVEGMQLLSTVPSNSAESEAAKQAWRQALVWNGPAPVGLPSLRDYLKRYPDPELSSYLKKGEEVQVGAVESDLSREEQQGYNALNANNLPAAESAFNAVLKSSPRSSAALSGLGYVRMRQQDFVSAVHYFEDAKNAAPNDSRIQKALETARFWLAMQQGNSALSAGQPILAETYFQQAAAMRPKNIQALQGYAGTLLKEGKAQSAIPIYRQITEAAPNDAESWRGLLRAQMQGNQPEAAAETLGRMPPSVKSSMANNLDFLTLEASIYAAGDQQEETRKLVQQAIQVANSQPRNTSIPVRLQLAGLLLQMGQAQQAVGIYLQTTDLHPENVDAWQGLVAAYLQNGDNSRAIAALQRMPKATYNLAIQNPQFLLSIASVYKSQNQLESAEEFVQRATQIEAKESRSSVATQVELGKIWLAEGRTDEADNLFRTIIQKSPDDAEAWKGYIEALHQQQNDEAAISQSEQLPEAVAQRLKSDPGYLSTIASVNAQLGQYDEALRLLRQAMFHYELLRQPVPVAMQLQMGWLLLDSNADERQLYTLLTSAGARRDLTYQQRRDCDDIWAAWSLRQAEAAKLAGDTQRQIAILQVALRALPYDNHIRGTLAGALLVNGDPRSAFALYRTWGLKGANVDDYRGAIGAATAVHEDGQAQTWLNSAMHLWPENPQVLMLAAQMAQQQGDYEKAKRYWQSALRTLPPDQAQFGSFGYAPPAARETHSLQDLARTLMPPDQMPDAASSGDYDGRRTQPLILPPATGIAPQPTPRTSPSGSNSSPSSFNRKPRPYAGSGSNSLTIQPISSGTSLQPGGGFQYAEVPQQDLDTPAQQTGQNVTVLAPLTQAPALYAPPSAPEARPPATSHAAPQSYDSGQQLSQRQEIETQIAAIEGRNSPFAGVAGLVSGRSGEPGFQKLSDEEASLEGSVVFGDSVRVTGVVRPVFLDSGTPDGTSTYRFGTLPVGATFPTQSYSGLSEELQVSTQNFGLRFGATPTGFPVYNWMGGLRWRIGGGPISILLNRDNVKDTMLSYAGATDPLSGLTWGGVMSNSGTISGNWGGAVSGGYGSIGYQYLQGTNVANNNRIDGDAGAYWRIFARNYGSLTLGANIFAMHYNQNLSYFTLGQGGYFSPQQYFLFNTPVRWMGTYKRSFEYSIAGSLGSQVFHENQSPYFPDNPEMQASSKQYYPAQSVIGVSYNLSVRADYRLPSNWYMGAFMNFNNSRDYNQQTIGFNVRYLFHDAPMTLEAPVHMIPDWRGFQPFSLPQ